MVKYVSISIRNFLQAKISQTKCTDSTFVLTNFYVFFILIPNMDQISNNHGHVYYEKLHMSSALDIASVPLVMYPWRFC